MLSERDLAQIASELYLTGPWGLRAVNHLRPYICPFGPLIEAVPPHSTVLDVGCGGGLFLGLLGHQNAIKAGIGFDSSHQAIDLAKQMSGRLPSTVTVTFERADVDGPWPVEEPVDVVSVIDVVHHIAPGDQRSVFQRAGAAVRPGGLLLYKDMVSRPIWRATANRLHDLLVARQWIHYLPMDRAIQWASRAGFRLLERRRIDRYWYGHEMAIFERLETNPRTCDPIG